MDRYTGDESNCYSPIIEVFVLIMGQIIMFCSWQKKKKPKTKQKTTENYQLKLYIREQQLLALEQLLASFNIYFSSLFWYSYWYSYWYSHMMERPE